MAHISYCPDYSIFVAALVQLRPCCNPLSISNGSIYIPHNILTIFNATVKIASNY